MAEITLSGTLAEQIQNIASREHRSPEDVLKTLVELYERTSHQVEPNAEEHALDAILGIYDDEITDLSTTVHETMTAYFKAKNDGTA